jgi:hypothetical protein
LTASGVIAPESPRIWAASLSFMVFLLYKKLFFVFAPSPGPEGKNKKEEAFFLSERRGRDVLHGE